VGDGTEASGGADAVRRERRGLTSRGGAGSVSSPEPKSSAVSATGCGLAVSAEARRRRGAGAGASSAETDRAAERRRGRWVVPSESELLVGIGNPETETGGNAVWLRPGVGRCRGRPGE
jgi:hypothetical protein